MGKCVEELLHISALTGEKLNGMQNSCQVSSFSCVDFKKYSNQHVEATVEQYDNEHAFKFILIIITVLIQS